MINFTAIFLPRADFRRQSLRVPDGNQAAYFCNDPIANLDDLPRTFSNWYEFQRRNVADFRMLPSNQRFCPGQRQIGNLEFRLE